MAHIRRLLTPEQKRRKREGKLPANEKPKGKWQATIRHPSNDRFSKSDPLKRVVEVWAAETEAAIRRGDFIDPAAGKMTLADWWDKWSAARRVESATEDKDLSRWRNHIKPRFGTWPLSTIKSWDVEEWVTEMRAKEVGAPTVQFALRLLTQMLTAAVRHKLLGANPALLVTAPTPPKHVDRFLSRDEAAKLLEQFSGEDRLFVEMLLYTGLRWSEAAGLKAYRVDLLRKRLQVKEVRDRRGKAKEPKSQAGVRPVPLTDELVLKLARQITEPADVLVFTSPGGEVMRYPNWLRRVWAPGLKAAKLADPQPTPHDLRHTYGSWLADAGRPIHEIAALMGHASLQSVQRYVHASEARFEGARAALSERQESGKSSAQKKAT